MKDYGSEYPKQSFLSEHGAKIGAALMVASAGVTLAALFMVAIWLMPAAIEFEQQSSRQIVATSRGINE